MSAIVKSIGSLFSNDGLSKFSEPDHALHRYGKPSADFVLCRDHDGVPTAIYGESLWDFNPYRLSAKKISKIYFDKVFGNGGDAQYQLVEEVKYLMYCLIYFAGGGRLGKLSPSTLNQYWVVLRSALQFCYEQRQKPMVGAITLQELFTVPVYLESFIREESFDRAVLSGILQGLIRVGEDWLGYAVVKPDNFALKRGDYHQHPVIPTRIYLDLINVAGALLDQVHPSADRFEAFIKCFRDEYYGVVHSYQRGRVLGGRSHFRPAMPQALKEHGLDVVFSGAFDCPDKRSFTGVLFQIQYLVKTVIHLYTGMRDQEVMRMPYHCLSTQVVRHALVDERGIERDKPQFVDILSTTTKFAGYKKEAAWLAPAEVIRAVEVGQAICRGLARVYNIDVDDRCPLFLNPSIVGFSRQSVEVSVTNFSTRATQKSALRGLMIQPEDLRELAQSDPSRDFHAEPSFAIGMPWPLTSHQFRRSLAFYGSSSGFLSLPTLRTQFKHMTIQMSRYYSNNYENLRTIFGYFDEKKQGFVLPRNHFAFEVQMAMPMSLANQLIADLSFSEQPLFGGTGSYMEKQKSRLQVGEIHIEDVRADTERRAKAGEISYRPTILGGCTKVGRCDAFLIGDYIECLNCEGAIIKLGKVSEAIAAAEIEMSKYSADSGEYQITKADIESLTAFKFRRINAVEI